MEIIAIGAFLWFLISDNYDATRYAKPAVESVDLSDLRDCKKSAFTAPGAPTAADSAKPGGMDASALKLQELTDQCMNRRGYRVVS